MLGEVRVNEITGPMNRNVLAEIWLTKPETARRVRQRIGAVLDWAFASGYRDTEAPMRSITRGLPRQPKKEGHFAAMPYADVPAFMQTLRGRESFSRMALEFAILTAARSGEVRGACWDEMDLDNALWTIPAKRMKANREHVVPLSTSAIRILRRCAELRIASHSHVFPGSRGRSADVRHDAHQAAARDEAGLHRAWLPFVLSRLGQRDDQSPWRDRRSRARAPSA